MNTTTPNPAREVANELELSLETLSSRLSKVERELDLECSNLRSLVNTSDPDIGRQLDAMSQSINELHESLNDVRGHLNKARDENALLSGDDDSDEPEADGTETPSGEKLPEAEKLSSMRHDEPVTLSGIMRALLMADEPEQRLTSEKK
ncbi:MAG: hypothetical protein Q7Q71_12000 [Verrucomicrobiota bacterium JB023]|nr:hypothetical protein [Verrucomicrobiota bacterium JB023]